MTRRFSWLLVALGLTLVAAFSACGIPSEIDVRAFCGDTLIVSGSDTLHCIR